MTEEQFLGVRDPAKIFEFVVRHDPKMSDSAKHQKMMIWSVSLLSSLRPIFPSDVLAVLDTAENAAFGNATIEEWTTAKTRLTFNRRNSAIEIGKLALHHLPLYPIGLPYDFNPRDLVLFAEHCLETSRIAANACTIDRVGMEPAFTPPRHPWLERRDAARAEVVKQQAETLRCIFGNPFRPATIDPRWLTATVIDVAEAIYQERAFDRMPILADALMDAGCDSEEIIAHCRGPGPHVRGCWVVDLLLGKE